MDTTRTDFLAFMRERAEEFAAAGKGSSMRNYVSTERSLAVFVGADRLPFRRISPKFVSEYAEWLQKSGVQPSTQSFYLRTFRAAVNRAVAEGLISESAGQMFRGTNTRIKFEPVRKDSEPNLSDLQRLAELDLAEEPKLQMARDMFLFAFYCRGMEFVDVLHLTPANILGGTLIYNKRGNGNARQVPLDPRANEIITRYYALGNRYIFPILDLEPDTPFATLRGRIARHLKQVGQRLNLPNLTFAHNITLWNTFLATTPFIPLPNQAI